MQFFILIRNVTVNSWKGKEMVEEKKRQAIVSVLKELGEATSEEIAVLASCSSYIVRQALNEEMMTNPSIKMVRSKGYVYSEGDSVKNSEGYTDLTPYMAMLNDENDSKYTDGAVYAKNEYSGIVGDPGFYLIIRGKDNGAVALAVFETTYKYYRPEKHITFKHGDREYYVEPNSPLSISDKKIGSCQFYLLMEDFTRIKGAMIKTLLLSDSLAMSTTSFNQADAIKLLKENGWLKQHDDAIAAVIQVREAPVAVLEADPNIELIKRERDIWKEAFFAVCGKAP